jgi:hypothetical protein
VSGDPDEIVAHRKDGTPITRAEWEQAEVTALGEDKAKKVNPSRLLQFLRKEKPTVDEPPEIPPEKEETALTVKEPEQVAGFAQDPRLNQKFELVRTEGMELGLIKKFKLTQGIDFYDLYGKKVFTKEGMSKFMPYLTIDGFKVSYKVVQVIDEPNYKYVRVRCFLGPEEAPVQMAEGSCDWREETSWQETISEKIKRTLELKKQKKEPDKNRSLMPEDIDFDPETGAAIIREQNKQFYIAYDHLRKRLFALRVCEGKAIRRAFSHLTGLSSTSSEEMEVMQAEAKLINEKVAA